MRFQLPALSEIRLPEIIRALQQIATGRSLAVGAVTLTPGATTTTVSAPWISQYDTISLTPATASAASALATTYIATVSQGSFTISHASAAGVDRTFRWSSAGG